MNIQDVQQELKALGYDPGPIDGIAGNMTYLAVKAFQFYKGLHADGVLDMPTLHALFPTFSWSDKLPELAMQIACFQVGVREEGDNRGLMVQAYQACVGIDAGESYCMAFIYWCFDQAAKWLVVNNPLYRTGRVLEQLAEREDFKVPAEDVPQPGDIGIIKLSATHGHCYIVRAPAEAGCVLSVEGNTNDDGSANGNGDYFRKRNIAKTTAFLRFK